MKVKDVFFFSIWTVAFFTVLSVELMREIPVSFACVDRILSTVDFSRIQYEHTLSSRRIFAAVSFK